MDYGELLCKAREINKNAANKEVRCYKTEFPPPKKLERSKVSSENVKKFLARREAEEKIKREEASKKREELLALRSLDKKAQRRVQVMLKSTKSANKSVMEDAIDNVNTAVTLEGSKQCDEDDYGYVSQEASDFYNKLINKYEKMENEASLLSKPKKEVKDLNAVKYRIKATFQKKENEEMTTHKRKKRKLDSNSTDKEEPEMIIEPEKKKKTEIKSKCKISASPPLKFDQLLQVAEKKQFEPILIDENIFKKSPERLMTQKEKIEFERDEIRKFNNKKNPNGIKECKDDNKQKDRNNKDTVLKRNGNNLADQLDKKLNNDLTTKIEQRSRKDIKKKSDCVKNSKEKVNSDYAVKLIKTQPSVRAKNSQGQINKVSEKGKFNDLNKTKVQNIVVKDNHKSMQKAKYDSKTAESVKSYKTKEKELSDIDKQLEMTKLAEKTKLKRMELKKIKLANVNKNRNVSHQGRRLVQSKRRISSDSEDDFIDDGSIDESPDYSSYINTIFGYDKSKYNDEGDECTVSNFAQQMQEERVSSKIGMMEDLEDIRKKREESARKKLKQKRA